MSGFFECTKELHDNCDLSRSAKWEVWPYAVAETFAKAAGRGVNRVQCGKDYFKDDSGTCVPRIQISIPNGNGMPEWPAWPWQSTDTDEDSDNDDQINEIKESSDEPNGNLTSSQIVQKNMTNQIQNPVSVVIIVIIICIFSYTIARRKRQGNYSLFSYPGVLYGY